MNRTTIDFGIDLGTTNSAVAVFTGNHGEPTKIIKNTMDGNDADITPSAVYIDKKGALRVGLRAKNRIPNKNTGDDVHIEFKRQMGTVLQRTWFPRSVANGTYFVLHQLKGRPQKIFSRQIIGKRGLLVKLTQLEFQMQIFRF